MPTWLLFLIALAVIVAVSRVHSRWNGDCPARLVHGALLGLAALGVWFALTSDGDPPVATLAYAAVVFPLYSATGVAACAIRSSRQHLREAQEPHRPVQGGPDLRRLVDDAAALGFHLLPDGIIGGHTSHGDAAGLRDDDGRIMSIVDNPGAAVVGVMTVIQGDGLLYTQSQPIDRGFLGAFLAHRSLVDASMVEVVRAHMELEGEARARGAVPVAFPADGAEARGQEINVRLLRHWLRYPWWNAARSVWTAHGPLVVFGLRSQRRYPAPAGPQPTAD